jgi:hypothetical protein
VKRLCRLLCGDGFKYDEAAPRKGRQSREDETKFFGKSETFRTAGGIAAFNQL